MASAESPKQTQSYELDAAVTALQRVLEHVEAAGGDPNGSLRPAIDEVKLQVFGAAMLAERLEDDDDRFEAMFNSMAGALCTVLDAAMSVPLDLPALRGFFAEAEDMQMKLSPLVRRQAERAGSAADLRERSPDFERLACAWECLGRHKDCPAALRSLLPGDVALRLRHKDFRTAMKGWVLRAKEQRDRATELLGRLERVQSLPAFREATRSWAEHTERMQGARELNDDARPVLAVGGRANAGKTTFLNAVLHRWIGGALPTDLLPVSRQENTSCITELHLREGAGPGGALAELSRRVPSPGSGAFEEDSTFSKQAFSEWMGLQRSLKESVQGLFQEERQQESRLAVTIFNAKKPLLLCDTPGMDGRNNMAAMKSFARSSIFLYVHLVAVNDGSVGSQPIELLGQLHGQSSLPPVVVLTKFEKLVEDSLREDASDEDASDDDASGDGPADDRKRRAELRAGQDVVHLLGVLARELPQDNGRRCLPLFAALSEKPNLKKGTGAGVRQLDEVLDFLGLALQEYTELRRADAFVSLVASETQALIDALLQSEPGLFSETDLGGYERDLVSKMERRVEEYFEGFPSSKLELCNYPSEERRQKLWSRATQRLLPDLEVVHAATPKTWSKKTYLQEVMRALGERWQEAYAQDMSQESTTVLSDFESALARHQRLRMMFYAAAPWQVLFGGPLVPAILGGGLLVGLLFAIPAAVGWAADSVGLYDSKGAAEFALALVMDVLHVEMDKIKEETKARFGELARQVVERMAAFRDPATSELGRAHNLEGCREDVGEAVKASRKLHEEMQAALLGMRWVGGDARLEKIVLRSLEPDV